ncbi:MAG TPA: hypothetical protein VGH19_07760 [Verrucomicrobiae bacterium]
MKSETLETQINSQRMSQSGTSLDQATVMVPAVGVGLLVTLMVVFYVYYRRKQKRHQPNTPTTSQVKKLDQSSRSLRKRGQTLAETGGLPPIRSSCNKEAAS